MNILIVSAEVSPFAKSGGLADVVGALPAEWKKFGQDPVIIMPKYGFIDTDKWGFESSDITLIVPMSYWTEYARLWKGYLPGTEVPVYLIEHNEYFDRPGIYGGPDEYQDNDRRFIFFCRAAMEAAKALNFQPDIIHAHDFHAAFTLAFLKSHYKEDYFFSRSAGVYTIHNLAYQGWFKPETALDYSGFGMEQFYPGSWFEHYGQVNAMKVGIMFADKITTVSPTYSKEIRMAYFSEGLQDVLNSRGGDLIGLLNGVDYSSWNPENDEFIPYRYSIGEFDIKQKNKAKFIKEYFADSSNPDLPLIGMVTRLTDQKGMDLIMKNLEHHLYEQKFRFALLGSGEARYEDFFRFISDKYPDRAFVRIGYDNELSHNIIASSDFLLMPSRFEPCGLTQMYALKYGTAPIVRQTGGLADTVREYDQATNEGTGFLFRHYDAQDMDFSIFKALELYGNQPHWDMLRLNAMNENFSSGMTAMEYLRVFKWALEKVKP
ncbi:MAG: glycogen synthase [Candidatus Kapaibacterium sp.]